MQCSYCWRGLHHWVAFHIGVSGHCVGCKCISSMPNVCYADCHWLVMIITSCSPVLPAECIYSPHKPCWSYQKLPEIVMVTLLCFEWAGRDRISSHGLKQSRHNCIILLLPATVSVYLELRIATESLMKQNDASNNAGWKETLSVSW